MDYSIFTADHILCETKRNNNMLLEQMSCEIEFIMTCLENAYINPIDLEIVQETFAETVRGIIDAVVTWFKDLFGRFRKKAGKQADKFDKWYEANKEKIENIDKLDVTGMKMETTPYWFGDERIDGGLRMLSGLEQEHIQAFLSHPTPEVEEKITALADEATFLANNRNIKPLVNKDGNLSEGAKHYFRMGDPNDSSKRVTLSGDLLKAKIKDMIVYCKNYKTNVVKKLDDDGSRMEQSIEKIKNQLKIRTESWSVLEETTFNNTCLRYCSNYEILQEVITLKPLNQAPNQPPKNQPTQTAAPAQTTTHEVQNKTAKPEPGKLIDTTDAKAVAGHKEDTEMSQYTAVQLKALKVLFDIMKKVIAAAMSVGEEKFVSYFNLIEQVVDKSKEPAKAEEKKEPAAEAKPEIKPRGTTPEGTTRVVSGKSFTGKG